MFVCACAHHGRSGLRLGDDGGADAERGHEETRQDEVLGTAAVPRHGQQSQVLEGGGRLNSLSLFQGGCRDTGY